MSVSQLPLLPVSPHSVLRPTTFNAESDAFFAAFPAFREVFNGNVPSLQGLVDIAPMVLAATGYKGPWASLVGALAIPASVTHAGKAYFLVESVADVTAHQPGVSSKWLAIATPQNVELLDTINAAGVAYVEWTNFATLANDYIELQVIGSNILSDANSRRLTCQLRINNNVQTTSFDGMVIGAASHTQVTGAMSDTNALMAQTNAPMDLRMTFGTLGVVAYGRAKYETVERNLQKMVVGTATPSGTPTTAIQGVRILGSAGTITGTFKLYGVRK